MKALGWPDWGDVPSWAAAGSLILAFWILLRDRIHRLRQSADSVAVWGDVRTTRSVHEKVDEDNPYLWVDITCHNAAHLPVRIVLVEAVAYYSWWYPTDYDERAAHRTRKYHKDTFVEHFEDLWLTPGSTVERSMGGHGIKHSRPQDDAEPVEAKVSVWRVALSDSTGRRWILRPSQGVQPRRFRWFHLLGEIRKFRVSFFHPWHTPRIEDWQDRFFRLHEARRKVIDCTLRRNHRSEYTDEFPEGVDDPDEWPKGPGEPEEWSEDSDEK